MSHDTLATLIYSFPIFSFVFLTVVFLRRRDKRVQTDTEELKNNSTPYYGELVEFVTPRGQHGGITYFIINVDVPDIGEVRGEFYERDFLPSWINECPVPGDPITIHFFPEKKRSGAWLEFGDHKLRGEFVKH